MPLDDAERRWGAAYLVIHRADLQRALVEVVRGQAGVELSLGSTILDFTDKGGRLSLVWTNGLGQARDEADLLIGADGLRSRVRDRLGFGAQDQAEFAGRVAYRAIVNADFLTFTGYDGTILSCAWEETRISSNIPCGADRSSTWWRPSHRQRREAAPIIKRTKRPDNLFLNSRSGGGRRKRAR